MSKSTLTLKNDIIAICQSVRNNDDPDDSVDQFARELAEAVKKYIESGLVKVETTGTQYAQSGIGKIEIP